MTERDQATGENTAAARRPMTRTTALVTGATAGIGHEFATQLAARGHDLVLVARDTARLEETAGRLRAAYGIEVEVLTADLSDRAQTEVVAARLAEVDRPVDLLINNAGFGLNARFLDVDVAAEEESLDVMCRAVLVLTHAAARAMVSRGSGRIINISSVASFIAASPYSAAKAWVTVFTESLTHQLAGTGVSATVVCPGFVRTEFHQRAEMDTRSLPKALWLSASDVVREALADAERGVVVSIPSRRYRAVVMLLRVLPRAVARDPRVVSRHRRT